MNKNKKDMRILVINPGSTSTKIAVYEDDKSVWMTGAHHHVSELAAFQHISDQYEYRKNFVLQRLADAGIDRHFDAVIGRGGLLHPLAGGVYVVNDKMKHDLMNHFTVIATYLDLGENDKAVSYLKEIGTEFSELTRQYTSSTMINAILNSKRQKAKGRGIELSVTSDSSSEVKTDETDLCTLIANTLDNAIEALPPDRTIKAEIADDGTTLFFSVSNRYDNKIERAPDGSFISSKADKKNHGLGMKNIQQAVERLNGRITITTDSGIFRVYAEIPLAKQLR